MLQDDEAIVEAADDEGTVGLAPPVGAEPFVVAPTNEDLFNVLSLDIAPVACLNLGDLLFDFDSSIVKPEVAKVLRGMPALRARFLNAKGEPPLLSIFGHADPEGDAEYNKKLSGRRAKAIYGLFTHDVEVWESLQTHPHGGDDWGARKASRMMAGVAGVPAQTARKKIFLAYMQTLLPEPIPKPEFLGRNGDAKGKADFQGCSEFNPLLILSAAEQKSFTKTERAQANTPNRRVVVLFFSADVRLDPLLWPCPRADESSAACKARFFADAKARSTPGPERKLHKRRTDATFSCRLYDRLAGPSPCDRILDPFRVRLFDDKFVALPFAPFMVTYPRRRFLGRADAEAFLTLKDINVPTECIVQWSRPAAGDNEASAPPLATDAFEFKIKVFVDLKGAEDREKSLRRLHNLGFRDGPEDEDDIRAFQTEESYQARFPGMGTDGQLDETTITALRAANDLCEPSARDFDDN